MPNLNDYKHCNWCSRKTDLGLCDACYAKALAISATSDVDSPEMEAYRSFGLNVVDPADPRYNAGRSSCALCSAENPCPDCLGVARGY